MIGAGPLGQRPEAGTLRGRIGLAPAGLAIRVVAGRVQIVVLLGAPHEVQLGEPLLLAPRLPEEPLGGAAHRRTGPVPYGHRGQLPPGDQLPHCLRGVEEAVRADAVQGDRVPARDLAHGEPVAAGGQIPAGRCVQRTQGLRGLLAADQDHRPVRGQPVAGRIRPDGVHPGVAQQPAQRVQCGGIGVRRRHQCRLAGEGHGGAEVPHRLGARPDGGQVSRAGRPVRLVGRADGGLHGRGLGAGRPAQQTPDDRGGQCGGPGHPRSGARSATPAAPTDLSDAPYAPASHGCSSSPSLTAGPHRRPIFPRRCPFGRTLGREPTIVAVRVSTGP